MKMSFKFIYSFCKSTWEKRYEYWNAYWEKWFEETIAVITSLFLSLC